MTGLTNGTTHDLTVTATNTAGSSAPAATAIAATPTAPPIVVVAPTTPTTATATPTPASPTVVTTQSAPRALASTGADAGILAAAWLLVLAGSALVVVARRLRSEA